MAEENKKWYVLRAISGKEMKVKETLDAARKNNPYLNNCISQVLVPTEKVLATRAGKKVQKERTLLSGYVFVEAELKGDIESFLQNTSNVIDFVRSRDGDKRPEPTSQAEMERMLGKAEKTSEQLTAAANDYMVGESVKVTFGPFSGFVGEIKDVNREKHELTVIVKVFGRETSLTLDISQVERGE
ncbi:MAG: transcription termination/antitermination factor NusG [Muribaculaceae bacterium]|nr:transcription termination/antitermination factor NusG [Muribaculaceae bacterium]